MAQPASAQRPDAKRRRMGEERIGQRNGNNVRVNAQPSFWQVDECPSHPKALPVPKLYGTLNEATEEKRQSQDAPSKQGVDERAERATQRLNQSTEPW